MTARYLRDGLHRANGSAVCWSSRDVSAMSGAGLTPNNFSSTNLRHSLPVIAHASSAAAETRLLSPRCLPSEIGAPARQRWTRCCTPNDSMVKSSVFGEARSTNCQMARSSHYRARTRLQCEATACCPGRPRAILSRARDHTASSPMCLRHLRCYAYFRVITHRYGMVALFASPE